MQFGKVAVISSCLQSLFDQVLCIQVLINSSIHHNVEFSNDASIGESDDFDTNSISDVGVDQSEEFLFHMSCCVDVMFRKWISQIVVVIDVQNLDLGRVSSLDFHACTIVQEVTLLTSASRFVVADVDTDRVIVTGCRVARIYANCSISIDIEAQSVTFAVVGDAVLCTCGMFAAIVHAAVQTFVDS
jgi:hypothetical protein